MSDKARKVILFLRVIPNGFWIVLIIAILLRIPGGEYSMISDFLINFLFLFFFFGIGIFIHETGHLFFSWATGGKPIRMIIGKGREVARFKVRGIKVIINTSLKGGLALSRYNDGNYWRLCKAVQTSGGAIFNFGSAYIVYLLFGFYFDSFGGEYGIDPASAFIASGVILGVSSLLPVKAKFMGVSWPSDGLSLLLLPFRKKDKAEDIDFAIDFFDGVDYLMEKKYDEAQDIFEKIQNKGLADIVIKINLGLIMTRKGEFAKALEICKSVLPEVEEEKMKKVKACLWNDIAWIYLVTGDIENANKYSAVAIGIDPDVEALKGTRGSVLIEEGEIDEGVKMLKGIVDQRFADSNSLSGAIYLCLASHIKGEKKDEKKYLDFITANESKLDIDDRVLWSRVKTRLAE